MMFSIAMRGRALMMLLIGMSAALSVPVKAQSGEVKQVTFNSVSYMARTGECERAAALHSSSPLRVGVMKSADYDKAFSQLVKSEKITVGSHPRGAFLLGSTFWLEVGTSARPASLKIFADGASGNRFRLQIVFSEWDGEFHQELSTSAEAQFGDVLIFSTGTAPAGNRRAFYAISLEPYP